MFTVKQVEVTNFRTHKHRVDDFPEHAITHITGGNGSGKSSIVNAVPWCLYGTSPNGVTKNKSLRRDGAPDDEPTEVAVTYSAGHETYKAVRTMSYRGSTKVNLYRIEADGSETHVAGPAVKDANMAILNTLGMGSDIFSATVFFQQKATDKFIESKPEERRVIIEKLTGITANSRALDECKVHRLANKRALDSKTVDRAGIEAHQKEVAALAKKVAKLESELTEQRATWNSLIAERRELDAKVKDARRDYQTAEGIKISLRALKARAAELKEQLDATQKRIETLQGRMNDESGEVLELSVVESMYNEKLLALQNAHTQSTNLQSALKTCESILQEAEGTIARASFESEAEAAEALKSASMEAEGLTRKLDTLRHRLSVITGIKLPEAEKSYAQISSLEGTCPTCAQPIPEKEPILNTIQSSIDALTKEKSEIVADIEDAEQLQMAVNQKLAAVDAVHEAYIAAGKATKEFSRIQSDLKKAAKELKNAESEHQSALTVFNDVKQMEELARSYEEQVNLKKSIFVAITGNNRNIKQAEATLAELPNVTEHALLRLENKLKELEDKIEETRATGTETNDKHTVAATQYAALNTQLQYELKEAEAYKSLLKERELLLATEATLKEFRQEVSARTIPELNKFASELVSGFTNGKFIGVTITDDFNVLAHFKEGSTREAQLLSGGEFSAVALAIGLAMSKVFSGSSSSLILDEAFTAYDPNNLDATIKTIQSSMGAQQIIIIAHNDSVDAIADYRIAL